MLYRCLTSLFLVGLLPASTADAQTVNGAPPPAPPIAVALQTLPPQPPSSAQPLTLPGASLATSDGQPTAATPPPPPSEQLADTLSARGRYLLAIQTLERLPPTAVVWNKLGVACLHMLMFDRARASFDAAIKLNPKYPEAYNNLGTLYYAERKFKKGDAAYHEALRLDPEVLERTGGHDIQTNAKGQSAGEVHYHMALSYAQAANYNLALDYLRKAIGEGFHDRNRLLHEKDFADLRTQPVFLQMVDDLKKD